MASGEHTMETLELKGTSRLIGWCLGKVTAALLILLLNPMLCYAGEDAGLVDLVNPFIGTAGGNTTPAATLPMGMVSPGPVSSPSNPTGYSRRNKSDRPLPIQYFKHLHISGTNMTPFYDVVKILPTIGGKLGLTKDVVRREDEFARPGYYRARFRQNGITAEMTCTRRGAIHRYTFPRSDRVRILLPNEQAERLSDTEVAGRDIAPEGAKKRHHVWYYMALSKPFEFVSDESGGAVLEYEMEEGEQLLVRVGVSWSDTDHARANLNEELDHWDFDRVHRKARKTWESALGKVKVSGGSREDRVGFYTAMYHTIWNPTLMSDADGTYRSAGSGHPLKRAEDREHYTSFSMWDTFRAVRPMVHLFFPRRGRDIVRSLLQDYRDHGFLPTGSAGYMPAYNMMGTWGEVVIADAWAKGIRDFDIETAMRAGLHDGYNKRMIGGWASDTHPQWHELGYLPTPLEQRGKERCSIYSSSTLDNVLSDWGVMRLARFFGNEKEYAVFRRKALNYASLFDPSIGWMRPRHADGRFWVDQTGGYAPSAHNTAGFTESTAMNWTFMVPHDLQGLINLMGGDERFAAKLDQVFADPEMGTNLNEMNHHLRYCYSYCGQPWKTQRLVRRMLKRYGAREALPTADDAGATSALGFWSYLGLYPVTPGVAQYIIGSPTFDRADLHLPNGKVFRIITRSNSPENVYIQSATLNGEPWNKTYLNHGDVVAGGEIIFEMGPEPNKGWGTSADSRPYSMSADEPEVLSSDTGKP